MHYTIYYVMILLIYKTWSDFMKKPLRISEIYRF